MAEIGNDERRMLILKNMDGMRKLRAEGRITPEQSQLLEQIEQETTRLGWTPAPGQKWGTPQPPDRVPTTEQEAIQPTIDPFTTAATIPIMGAAQGARKAADVALPRILKGIQSVLTSPTLNAAQVQGAVNTPGGAGATVGDIGGQLLASRLPGASNLLHAAARVALPAVGAAAGYAADQTAHGQKVDPKGAAAEVLFTGAGGAIEEGVRGVTNFLARHSAGGRALQKDVMARELREGSEKIVNPPGKEVVHQAYKQLYDTKLPVFMDYSGGETTARTFLNNLPDDKLRLLRNELLKWPAEEDVVKGLAPKTNPGMVILDRIMGNATPPGEAPNIDIQAMDRFRQFLNKRARGTRDIALGPILDDLRGYVDDLVELSIGDARSADFLSRNVPGMQTVDVSNLIHRAREAHTYNLAADAFDDLAREKTISGYSDDPTGTFRHIHLGHLRDAMEDPASVGAENAVERISRIPGALDEYKKLFDRLQRKYQKIEILSPSGRGRSQAATEPVGRLFGFSLATPEGRRLLEKGITEGRGKIAYNNIAAIANLSRRALEDGAASPASDTSVGSSGGTEGAPPGKSFSFKEYFDLLNRSRAQQIERAQYERARP